MATSAKNNSEDHEIDLSRISKSIKRRIDGVSNSFFQGIIFIRRNIIVIALLFILGAGLGYYLDKTTKIYNHEIVVTPNLNSYDYLYNKINLISAKINEGDTVFLKETVGIKKPKKLLEISIKPISDVYKFIENKPDYFELIKLMADNGDVNKIITDEVTSKNFSFHQISFTTNEVTDQEMTVKPLMNYLNQSEYYEKIRDVYEKNIKIKMTENDSLIQQINNLLDGVGQQKTSNVYINDNTQLNDVIKTKDALVAEQGARRLDLITIDKVIKDSSNTLNIRNLKSTNGKMKIILPFLFIIMFIVGGYVRNFYKRQLIKQNN